MDSPPGPRGPVSSETRHSVLSPSRARGHGPPGPSPAETAGARGGGIGAAAPCCSVSVPAAWTPGVRPAGRLAPRPRWAGRGHHWPPREEKGEGAVCLRPGGRRPQGLCRGTCSNGHCAGSPSCPLPPPRGRPGLLPSPHCMAFGSWGGHRVLGHNPGRSHGHTRGLVTAPEARTTRRSRVTQARGSRARTVPGPAPSRGQAWEGVWTALSPPRWAPGHPGTGRRDPLLGSGRWWQAEGGARRTHTWVRWAQMRLWVPCPPFVTASLPPTRQCPVTLPRPVTGAS